MKKPAILLAVVIAVCAIADSLNADESRKSEIATYESVQQNTDYRVSLLGLTKGIAFLDSQELIADAGRSHGNNAVPWMKVAVAIENLTNKDGHLGFKAETADGAELVGKIRVETNGRVTGSRSRGTAEMDLDFPPLLAATFPTAPPKDAESKKSKVYVFTLSGKFQQSDTVTLRFTFGEANMRRELVFKDVPLP